MRTYAQLTTSFVGLLQPRRRGRVDLVLGRLRGHRADRRAGLQRPALRRGAVHRSTIAPGDIRRERIGLPLLRDERPELQVRELSRIVAERAGLASDRPATPPPRRAWMSRPSCRARIRSGSGRRASRRRADRRRTGERIPAGAVRGDAGAGVRAADGAGHRYRRRATGHQRVHPRPAPAGRVRARGPRPVGRHRLGARRVPVGGGHRRGTAAVRADAVPHVVAGVAGRRRGGRGGARLRPPSWSTSARWSTATSPARPDASPLRRGNFMARSGWPCCTTAR